MRTRRLVAGLAIVTALGLTACGPKAAEPTAAPAATGTTAPAEQPAAADPAAELAAAAAKLGDDTVKIEATMLGGMSISGVADPAKQLADISMSVGTGTGDEIRTLRVGNDMYLKFGGSLSTLAGSGKEWMHLDIADAGQSGAFGMSGGDPDAAAKMIAAAATVEKTGDGAYAGTLDLTKASVINEDALAKLNADVSAVPFTAKVDAEGRLVEISIDMDALADGAGTMVTKYSDFGTPVSVEAPPASQVGELPAEMKGLLNG